MIALDHSQMHLGKRPRRHDARTLELARYMTAALPAPPPRVDWTMGITDWGMMLNNTLGCCTIAAVGHAVQTWTRNAIGRELTVPDPTILQYYESWDGYNPANPGTDAGGVELDVLNDWRQQGFDGNSLDAYVAIDVGTRVPGSGLPIPEIATAIWLFGGAYIGVELPISAQNQDVWDVPANPGPNDEPGSWGGHAIYLVAYDMALTGLSIDEGRLSIEKQSINPQSTITCITWGQTKKMTWAWFEKYCSEAYALVSKDWLNASGIAPSGFDLATLEGDLKFVTA